VCAELEPSRELDPFSLSSSWVGHRYVLHVAGEVDMATAPDLGDAAGAALESGARELWIDLTRAEFLDVAGARVLFDLHRVAGASARRFAVVCPPGAPRRLLDLMGCDGLDVYASLSEAHLNA
jgi:anti-anti-sigma factor